MITPSVPFLQYRLLPYPSLEYFTSKAQIHNWPHITRIDSLQSSATQRKSVYIHIDKQFMCIHLDKSHYLDSLVEQRRQHGLSACSNMPTFVFSLANL